MNNFFVGLGLLVFQLLCCAEGAGQTVVYDVNGNVAKRIVPDAGKIAYSYDRSQAVRLV